MLLKMPEKPASQDEAAILERTPSQEQWKPRRQEYLILITLAILSFMTALDATILTPALPTLAKSLNGSASEAFWAGTSYLLTSTVFQPFLAAISGIFGRQQILFISVLLFLIGSILASVAGEFPLLLSGRCFQGIGGGGIMAICVIIISDIIPLRQRPVYYTFIQAAWAMGSITGPIIGGAIVQKTSWRWIFYLNFPLCAIGLLMVPLVMRLSRPVSSSWERLARVDWIGAALFVSSTASLLLGITWGGIEYSWNSYQTILPIILGSLGLGATIFWEWKGARVPLIALSIFKGRSAGAIYVCALSQGIALYGNVYYVSFYLEVVKNLSPILTGVGMLPLFVTMIPSTIIAGGLVARVGHYRWAIWSGWTIAIIGTGLIISFDVNTPTYHWVLCLLVLGLGHGMNLSTLSFAIQAIMNSKEVPYALAMYTCIRTFGSCAGLAVGGTVLQNVLAKKLAEQGLPEEIARNAEGYAQTLLALPLDSPYRIKVVAAYAKAFQVVFEVLTGICAMGGLAGLLVESRSLDRELESEHHVLRRESVG